ncbi:MAG: ABC transporter ATP-binding protein [bacterium]
MNIKIKSLNKKIGRLNILKDINLNFGPENINVLIGPNGAGKTTLLRIIGLLDKPTSGEIFYNGNSSAKFTSRDKLNCRRKMGFVFQNPIILEGTVYQNIIYPLNYRKLKIEKPQIEEIIHRTGLSDKIDKDAKKLSGGEKQRLQIARVLMVNPDLFLLDEPTNNLDPISTKRIQEIICELVQSKKTIILTTHNLLQAKHFAHKIFFLKNGEIIQEGSSKDIFETPLSLDIAEFSLSENIFSGEILKEREETYLLAGGLKINVVNNILSGKVTGIIRPEDILISKTPIVSSARNCFKGEIKKIENIGAIYSVEVSCNNLSLTSLVTKQSVISLELKSGSEVYLIFKATSVYLLPVSVK